MIPAATADFYRSQQRLSVLTVALMKREWLQMGSEFDLSWQTVGPRLTLLLASAQLGAATAGSDYVPRVLEETGQQADPEGAVNPRALIGVAADGRPLDGLLYRSVVEAKGAVGSGLDVPQALAQGGRWLDMAAQTAVADAGRLGSSVAIASRPKVTGWVRMLNTPSCSRCAVLAGRWYRWSSGFLRHPRCDCRHIPSSENRAGDFTTDPKAYFDSLSEKDQARIFTNDGAKAINDGADIGSVVNARRGMSDTKLTTTAAAQGRPRLMPEAIYQRNPNRADAIAALRAHGYLT